MEVEQLWRDALGVVVRRRRKEAGLTQERLASKVEVTRTTVAAIEHATVNVSYDSLIRVCRMLNVAPSALLAEVEALLAAPTDFKDAKKSIVAERLTKGRPRSKA